LGTVSPFLKSLLTDFERRGDDVITIFLPHIKVMRPVFSLFWVQIVCSVSGTRNL
jgi:hypothetical protein